MSDYFPTAKQAREYTNGIINKKLSSLYAELKGKIMEAANKGENYIYYYNHLPQPAITHLRELGYEVTWTNQYNEVDYTISWEQ